MDSMKPKSAATSGSTCRPHAKTSHCRYVIPTCEVFTREVFALPTKTPQGGVKSSLEKAVPGMFQTATGSTATGETFTAENPGCVKTAGAILDGAAMPSATGAARRSSRRYGSRTAVVGNHRRAANVSTGSGAAVRSSATGSSRAEAALGVESTPAATRGAAAIRADRHADANAERTTAVNAARSGTGARGILRGKSISRARGTPCAPSTARSGASQGVVGSSRRTGRGFFGRGMSELLRHAFCGQAATDEDGRRTARTADGARGSAESRRNHGRGRAATNGRRGRTAEDFGARTRTDAHGRRRTRSGDARTTADESRRGLARTDGDAERKPRPSRDGRGRRTISRGRRVAGRN